MQCRVLQCWALLRVTCCWCCTKQFDYYFLILNAGLHVAGFDSKFVSGVFDLFAIVLQIEDLPTNIIHLWKKMSEKMVRDFTVLTFKIETND